jgi:hypothetical protein
MYRYELTFLGPLPESWWTERNLDPSVHYAGGRIYVIVDEQSAPVMEYPVAIMDGYSWSRLNMWLNKLETETLTNLGTLFERFESETKSGINWILDSGGARQEIALTEPEPL